MMLWPVTCEPPTCCARLPQKFSAATTLTTVDPPPVVVFDEVEQLLAASASSTGVPANLPRRRLDTLNKCIDNTGCLRERRQPVDPTLTKTVTVTVIKCKNQGTRACQQSSSVQSASSS